MARSPVANLDVESLSDNELREAIHQLREALGQRVQNRLDEFRALALEAGFSVNVTPIGEGEGRRRRSRDGSSQKRSEGTDRRAQVAPMYRNPDNHTETWSGRGREPLWMKQKLAAGARKEQFLIIKETAPAPPA